MAADDWRFAVDLMGANQTPLLVCEWSKVVVSDGKSSVDALGHWWPQAGLCQVPTSLFVDATINSAFVHLEVASEHADLTTLHGVDRVVVDYPAWYSRVRELGVVLFLTGTGLPLPDLEQDRLLDAARRGDLLGGWASASRA
jgi:hypothetical protein